MDKRLLDQANEGGEAGSGQAPKEDLGKILKENFSKLEGSLKDLQTRISKVEQPVVKQKAPVQEEDDDLDTLILSDPKKAVDKITSRIKEEVMGNVKNEEAVKTQFNTRFSSLQSEFPEIGDVSSDLHKRAKEIMLESATGQYDSTALELAVRRAAAEKGVQPMQYRRKQQDSDDDGEGYLGGGSSGAPSDRQQRRGGKGDKLPAATLAFAELVGMNVKDPKVVEQLTKRFNERKNNWNKYK